MKKISLAILVALAAFFAALTATAFASTSVAQVAAPASSDGSLSAVLDALRPIYDAFAHGSYVYAGALALVLAVALVKRYLGPKVPWLHTDVGGTALTLAGAFAAAVAAAVAGGAGLSLAIAWHAVTVAAGAAGGYELVRHLVIPSLRKLAAKCPAWMQVGFNLIFFVFDRPSPVAQADAAGTAAVVAKPSTGVAGVIGKPTDVA